MRLLCETHSLPLDFGSSSLTFAGLFPLERIGCLSCDGFRLLSGLFPGVLLFGGFLLALWTGDCAGLRRVIGATLDGLVPLETAACFPLATLEGLVPLEAGGVLSTLEGLATIIICYGSFMVLFTVV